MSILVYNIKINLKYVGYIDVVLIPVSQVTYQWWVFLCTW
jgi:hypothetical protein